MAESVKYLTDSEALSFTSFGLYIQLSLTVPRNGKLTTLEAAVPLLESSDVLKAPPCVELKSHFLKFSPWGLVLPAHDIPRSSLRVQFRPVTLRKFSPESVHFFWRNKH